jgi:hypothetical protein
MPKNQMKTPEATFTDREQQERQPNINQKKQRLMIKGHESKVS